MDAGPGLELLVTGARLEYLAGRVRQDPVSLDPRILELSALCPGLPHAMCLRDDAVTLSVEDPVRLKLPVLPRPVTLIAISILAPEPDEQCVQVGHFDIGLLREVKVILENPTLKD